MLEIDLQKLEKKKVWVKDKTKRGGGYWSHRKVGQKDKENSENGLISDLKNVGESNEDFAERYGWNTDKSDHFRFIKDDADIFIDNNKIYGMAELSNMDGGILRIRLLEVNPDMRRQGHGIKVMKKIVDKALNHNVETISLNSANENSDKFYNAIGMTMIKQHSGRNSYVADPEWMKRFIEV